MEEMALRYNKVRRIFLADGDALVLKTQDLKDILQKIRELFPYCERVGIYATPNDILRKSPEELKSLKEHGLGIVYLGIESGSDKILKDINKGADSKDMIEAGRRITSTGIKLSVTLISGLGGKDGWQEHAKESARVINAINPDYLGLLTLLIEPGTRMYDMVKEGTFKLLSTEEVALETQMLIRNLELENCIFRSNHASNYFSLAGTLPHDKGKLLEQLDNVLNNIEDYSGEYFRRL
jgi:radical SAM superfamily enzyme YgiQ (UPF0313 family)